MAAAIDARGDPLPGRAGQRLRHVGRVRQPVLAGALLHRRARARPLRALRRGRLRPHRAGDPRAAAPTPAGASAAARSGARGVAPSRGVTTPESYLGALRAERFANGAILPGRQDFGDAPAPARRTARLRRRLGRSGARTRRPGPGAALELRVRRAARLPRARLARPARGAMRVLLDGRPIPDALAGARRARRRRDDLLAAAVRPRRPAARGRHVLELRAGGGDRRAMRSRSAELAARRPCRSASPLTTSTRPRPGRVEQGRRAQQRLHRRAMVAESRVAVADLARRPQRRGEWPPMRCATTACSRLTIARPRVDRRAPDRERLGRRDVEHLRARRASTSSCTSCPGLLLAVRDRAQRRDLPARARDVHVPPHGRAELDGDRDRARRLSRGRRASRVARSSALRCSLTRWLRFRSGIPRARLDRPCREPVLAILQRGVASLRTQTHADWQPGADAPLPRAAASAGRVLNRRSRRRAPWEAPAHDPPPRAVAARNRDARAVRRRWPCSTGGCRTRAATGSSRSSSRSRPARRRRSSPRGARRGTTRRSCRCGSTTST